MDVSKFFCERCGRIKRKCICKKESTRKKNLRLLNEISPESYSELRNLFDTDDEIIHYRILNPVDPLPDIELSDLNFSGDLKLALIDRGIDKLYNFQKDAIEFLLDGKNVVITAPTGFGKTEAFVIPMIERVRNYGKGIIIYPTKALAADQELKIRHYSEYCGLRAIRFDGDSTARERRDVLNGRFDILLTNPDMLDYHLRNTAEFRKVVKDLCFLAVDELHYYSGIIGANLYYLIRRLKRFRNFQIACASATLSNAKEFAESLFDEKFEWVKAEKRKGESHIVMLYTQNLFKAISDIVKSFPDKKVLIFGNSYRSVEYFAFTLNRQGIRAAIHKAGLRKDVRKEVERRFRDGEIKVVVSTSTLELGVDIGDVDVVVSEIVSFPHFIQRLGRAGRMGQKCVGVILLRSDDAISNYYREKPEEYFDSEQLGFVEKENEELLNFHLISMAIERPFSINELGDFERRILEDCLAKGYLMIDDRVFATDKGVRKMREFSMRGIGDSVKMYRDGKVIGERSLPVAIKEMFPGAVLIHNGERLRSVEFSLSKAVLEPCREDIITQPLYTSIPVIKDIIERIGSPVSSAYCSLEITMSVFGYMERSTFGEDRAVRYLDEPVSYTFSTKGFLFSAPFPDSMDYDDFYAGSFHALEHVLIETSDMLTGGGSSQIGGISTPDGDIFIYDASFGGSGLSRLLFKRLERAFRISYDVLKNCKCGRIEGCPSCTYSYQCGNNNTPLNRIGAMNIIEKIFRGIKKRLDDSKYSGYTEFRYFP
ncbi:Distinct helicase family with a unique C-terminal domain including a metal-binding cysteine cluster [Archaeoglobus sulfaticallidus PM70-1]|uniref:Distinct helicase family with a unique C-terminal domain including a metal-binding cysteine cluster n=1 Tax=Archaeoglobus sulfaticallidus PM70-1 TaxID=387631 RepID=N0BB30_9EURY|nr:DEAD/DEAH box helicase [Archaeoglobus sulfaticallidus]AGK60814.1 Distinct helicase family with a unique C-terminal domain including a metal-binding cysteine cluster [Archaeoglobus sulfaticallidus PM70-1]